METDEKALLRAGYDLVKRGFDAANELHDSAKRYHRSAERYRRTARAGLMVNLVWAALNMTISLRSCHGHGARTDQTGILAGSDPTPGRGVSSR